MNNKTNSWKSILIKTALVSFLIIGGLSIYSNYYDGSNGESHMTIEEIELGAPTKYLELVGDYNKSFWGTEYKIKGKIINKAMFATFKDVVIEVNFLSKTGTTIKSKNYTLYEIYNPNSETDFTLNVDNFKNVKTINCNIVAALPNN